MSGATEARTPGRPPGKALARLRGAAGLVVLALSGLALWRLGGGAGASLRVEMGEDADGSSVWIIMDEGAPAGAAPAAVIVSRVPISFDARRRLIEIRGTGAKRIVPRGARTVLVGEDGRLAVHARALLPTAAILAIAAAPSEDRVPRLKELLRKPSVLPPGSPGAEAFREWR